MFPGLGRPLSRAACGHARPGASRQSLATALLHAGVGRSPACSPGPNNSLFPQPLSRTGERLARLLDGADVAVQKERVTKLRRQSEPGQTAGKV